MDETTNFVLCTLIATLLVFVLIFSNRSIDVSEKLARAFYFFGLFLGLAALVRTILSVSGVLSPNLSAAARQALSYPGWLVLGAGISSSVLILSNAFGHSPSSPRNLAFRSFVKSDYFVKGLCLVAASYFLATEVGKLAHDAEMRQFFLDSGYPIRFLYFIIVMETLGSIGLLITRTIIPAAAGLAIIMCGAMYTHYKNGDPFSDSLEALYLLIVLVCIIVISSFRLNVSDQVGKGESEVLTGI